VPTILVPLGAWDGAFLLQQLSPESRVLYFGDIDSRSDLPKRRVGSWIIAPASLVFWHATEMAVTKMVRIASRGFYIDAFRVPHCLPPRHRRRLGGMTF